MLEGVHSKLWSDVCFNRALRLCNKNRLEGTRVENCRQVGGLDGGHRNGAEKSDSRSNLKGKWQVC